jgi:hypothetical protein
MFDLGRGKGGMLMGKGEEIHHDLVLANKSYKRILGVAVHKKTYLGPFFPHPLDISHPMLYLAAYNAVLEFVKKSAIHCVA